MTDDVGGEALYDIPIHPFADMFPMVGDVELKELADDMKKNCQIHPILTYQGKVLDGRNRLKACRLAGIRPYINESAIKSDAEAIAFVVSENIMRRHLTTEQRADIASKLAPSKRGGDRKSQKIKQSNDSLIPTVKEAAAMMKVSPASVHRAKAKASGKPKSAPKPKTTAPVKTAAAIADDSEGIPVSDESVKAVPVADPVPAPAPVVDPVPPPDAMFDFETHMDGVVDAVEAMFAALDGAKLTASEVKKARECGRALITLIESASKKLKIEDEFCVQPPPLGF